MKIWLILKAWMLRYGILSKTKEVSRMSNQRLKECEKCPESKVSSILEIIGEEGVYTDRLFCGICKCPCVQKTLIKSESCPIEKWGSKK